MEAKLAANFHGAVAIPHGDYLPYTVTARSTVLLLVLTSF